MADVLDELNLDSIIPKVVQFPSTHLIDHRGCLLTEGHELVNPKKVAMLECPTCGAYEDFYSTKQYSTFEAVHCKGNKSPDCPCGTNHMVVCAGILEPHLHVACTICKNTFLMSLPEKK